MSLKSNSHTPVAKFDEMCNKTPRNFVADHAVQYFVCCNHSFTISLTRYVLVKLCNLHVKEP